MQKLAKIAVATDFSVKADNAIVRAIEIAKKNKAKLILIHVAKQDAANQLIGQILPVAKKIMLKPIEYAKQQLKQKIKSFAKHKIKITNVNLTGDPAKKLLDYANKHKIDLLVMGARGDYSIHDWFVGTTTETVVKNTKVPVLIVKNIPKKPYQNILVPVDFSAPSQLALQYANDCFSAKNLEVMHIIDHEYEELLEKNVKTSDKLKSIRKTLIQTTKSKLLEFIEDNKLDNLSYKIKVGYPSLEITKEAKKQHIDLVVMGTSGHSKKYYVKVGRVATMVLYEVAADVLLIPPIK